MTDHYAVLLDSGETVFRFDPDPVVGEVIVDSQPLGRQPEWYETFDWTAGALTLPPVADLEALLVAAIDSERKRRMHEKLKPDPDPLRQIELVRKGEEARSDQGPWPWLDSLAADAGTTRDDERLAVLFAMDEVELVIQAITNTAITGKRRVRAAIDGPAKLAAYQSITWP